MNLYEITTGSVGMSYERCYAWVPSVDIAEGMFKEKYPNKTIDVISILFNYERSEFITNLSTEGWEWNE